jgi:hypothetical protein
MVVVEDSADLDAIDRASDQAEGPPRRLAEAHPTPPPPPRKWRETFDVEEAEPLQDRRRPKAPPLCLSYLTELAVAKKYCFLTAISIMCLVGTYTNLGMVFENGQSSPSMTNATLPPTAAAATRDLLATITAEAQHILESPHFLQVLKNVFGKWVNSTQADPDLDNLINGD